MTHARTPVDLHQLFMDGVNNKDIDALMALYEPDSLTIGLDGSRLESEAALRAMLTGLAAAVDHIEGSTRKVIVHGDHALMSATFTANGGGLGRQRRSRTPATGRQLAVPHRRPDLQLKSRCVGSSPPRSRG